MTDFDNIYTELFKLNNQIYNMESIHMRKEHDSMIKEVNFELRYVSGSLQLTKLTITPVSQFERVVIRAKVLDYDMDNPAIALKMHLASPNYQISNPNNPEDYEFHQYMMPSQEDPFMFEININKIIGDKLTIGNLNSLPTMFQLFDGVGFSNSAPSNVELYKTNTSTSYTSTDMTGVYTKLNELTQRQKGLEELL